MQTCSYCRHPGHYKPKCDALAADKKRAKSIEAENAGRVYQPEKNPSHWERLSDARAAVRDQLNLALEELSDRSPAVKFINQSIVLLEALR